MAHGSRMIDWEDLAQRQIVEIQRALTESIRARATEVPVFFSRARNGKGGTCLGVFEGYSLMEGPPAQPDEMPRITLFIDTPGSSSESAENCVSPRGSDNLSPRIGTLLRVGRRTDCECRLGLRRARCNRRIDHGLGKIPRV